MNRITRYALALALGLSLVSTAAFAADPSSQLQSANAQNASPQIQSTYMPGPYDGPDMYSLVD